MNRRQLIISFAAAVLLGSAFPAMSQAGWQPTKPVQIVVHSSPGAGNDRIARKIAAIIEKEGLADVRFEVVNKPGGGATLAINYMIERTGDAHTIAATSNSWLTNKIVQKETKHGLLDLNPIATLGEDPFVVLVRSDSKFDSLKDFIEAAKAQPGKLNQSGATLKSRDSLISKALMDLTGTTWNYIFFKSRGERMAALLGGHTDIYMTGVAEAAQQVRGGRVKVVAQLAANRTETFPDAPTIQEVYDVPHLASIRSVVAVAEMPKEAMAYYEDLIRRVMETEDWKKFAQSRDLVGGFRGTEDTVKLMQTQEGRIRDLAKKAGVPVYR